METLISFPAIFTAGALSGLWIYAYRHKRDAIVAWEYKHLWNPLKEWVCNLLVNNKRFMAWLNKPQKHGRPDEDWITGQIKVFGDVWRL